MKLKLSKHPSQVIVPATHQGLLYEDGRLLRVLEAGRFARPKVSWIERFKRQPQLEVLLVDMRERDLTIKGQEILTSDKVAIRVSILVQFRVIEPVLASHRVENYEERLYGDVQLAARRSLAAMKLEEILTNRNRLSEDILAEVQDSASGYGVAIGRADVKDLIFPGNLQEIMNRVLAAGRQSEAQLVEARTRAEVAQIEAQSAAKNRVRDAEAKAEAERLAHLAEAEVAQAKSKLEAELFQLHAQNAKTLDEVPALLRLEELKALARLAENANARIYLGDPIKVDRESA